MWLNLMFEQIMYENAIPHTNDRKLAYPSYLSVGNNYKSFDSSFELIQL